MWKRIVEPCRVLCANSPDSIRVLDREGQVRYGNDASLLAPHCLIESQAEETPGAYRPSEIRAEVFNKGVFQRFYVTCCQTPAAKAERKITEYYEMTVAPIRDRRGAIVAVMETLRDETINLGVQHYLIDQTQRQEAEALERRQQAEALQRKEAALAEVVEQIEDAGAERIYRDRVTALSDMAGGLAHEIRTPLGAIVSSADGAERMLERIRRGEVELDERRFDRLTERMRLVGEGARRIHAVLKALQNFSRLDEAAFKDVSLEEGLDSTLQLIQFRLGDRIRVRRDYRALRALRCRPDALNQVFMNLLVNATQAIPECGEIVLQTEDAGEQAVVRVIDSGVGIQEEQLTKVFRQGFTTRGAAGVPEWGCRCAAASSNSTGERLSWIAEPVVARWRRYGCPGAIPRRRRWSERVDIRCPLRIATRGHHPGCRDR